MEYIYINQKKEKRKNSIKFNHTDLQTFFSQEINKHKVKYDRDRIHLRLITGFCVMFEIKFYFCC